MAEVELSEAEEGEEGERTVKGVVSAPWVIRERFRTHCATNFPNTSWHKRVGCVTFVDEDGGTVTLGPFESNPLGLQDAQDATYERVYQKYQRSLEAIPSPAAREAVARFATTHGMLQATAAACSATFWLEVDRTWQALKAEAKEAEDTVMHMAN